MDIQHARHGGGDVLSAESTMRRRILQQNAADTGNTRLGGEHMDYGDSRQDVHTEGRLTLDKTEDSPQSATVSSNDVGKRYEDIIDLVANKRE